MKHKDKTKGKHIDESLALRKSIDELEKLLAKSKLSEKALQGNEELYRKLVEVCPDTVAVHSEGKIVFINKAGANLLLATNAEQLIGKPIKDFLHPDYRDRLEQQL